MSVTLVRRLRYHLRRQHQTGYILAEAIHRELGYLYPGTFYWVIGPSRRGRTAVRWVSSDYQIYTNPIRHFRLPPGWRKRLQSAKSE